MVDQKEENYGIDEKKDRFIIWDKRTDETGSCVRLKTNRFRKKDAFQCIVALMKDYKIKPSELLDFIMERHMG